MEPEIVDSAGEHVYAWETDGSTVSGFPVRLDPSLSRPQDRTRNNHIKRGFTASPALGDLNEDGELEIVVPALDQHVYVWDGDGNPMPGFPKQLRDPAIPGAEILTTAALGDVNGDGKLDIVTPTQEFDDNPSAPQTPGTGAAGGFSTSSPTSWRTCSAAAAACTRSTATGTCCRAGPRRRTGSCPTRCRSSAPASTTCSRTWTTIPSWRRSATSRAAT